MIIRRTVLDDIHRVLEGAYPEEGCGLLIGVVDGEVRVREQLWVANRRASEGAATSRYLIAPEDFRAASRRAADRGLEIVGAYHSHPDVPARPSPYDREHAWPWYEYLIVSVVQGTAKEMRAYRLADDRTRFEERDVRVEE